MIDLMEAVQTAVFEALSNRQELTARSQVTQHVKQDMLAAGPITRIGKVESAPAGGKGGQQLEEVSVDVETIYRGMSQAEVLAIMHQQRLALDGQDLSADEIAKSATPEVNVQVVKGSIVKFEGLVSIGNFSCSFPDDEVATYSFDMKVADAPVTDDLGATA